MRKKEEIRLKAEGSPGIEKDGSTGLKNERTVRCGQKYT